MKPASKNSGKKKQNSTSNTPSVKTSKQTTKVQGKTIKPGGMIGNSSSIKGGQY
jgi:hypothetical protein